MTGSGDGWSRRAVLAGGATLVGTLAGCSGRRAGRSAASGAITERRERDRYRRAVTGRDSASAGRDARGEPAEAARTETAEVGRRPADAIGISHAAGTYSFTDRDYLNEGAVVAEAVGANVLKVWLQSMPEKYPFDTEWPGHEDPVEVARTPQVRRLFDRSFGTCVLVTASAVGDHNFYFRDGFTDAQYEREVATFERLTRHLLETYDGTGTEFVLQHWEGDWGILGSYDPTETASPEQFDAMVRWLDARQEGIRRARAAVDSDVTVLGAAEVNLVVDAMSGTPRVVTEVVPRTSCDLVSLSAWQVLESVADRTDPRAVAARVREVLAFIEAQAPEPDEYARARLGDGPNVYVGEVGWPLNDGETTAIRLLKAATEAALAFDARYVLYWQVFDNETRGEVTGRPTNADVPGHHLVRPDGTKAPSWHYLARRTTATAPARGEWTPLTFRFDRTVPEHELNADVDPGTGRQLTAALAELTVEGPAGRITYDVGRPGTEPVVGRGVSAPETDGEATWRWLASGRGEHRFYLRTDRVADAWRLRLVASPAVDGMGATVSVGDVTSEHTLRADEWLAGESSVPLAKSER